MPPTDPPTTPPRASKSRALPAPHAADTVTLLLDGSLDDQERLSRLLPLVYAQLRAHAKRVLGNERPGQTLQATALVHEAYLKLVGPRRVPWASRAHFYAAAAEAMRQILLDHAKSRARRKRGGGRALIGLSTIGDVLPAPGSRDTIPPDYLALDQAIRRLEIKDPRAAQVVRLRFYAGLEIAQTALALGVSEGTVKNDWRFAQAWLEKALRSDRSSSKGDEP